MKRKDTTSLITCRSPFKLCRASITSPASRPLAGSANAGWQAPDGIGPWLRRKLRIALGALGALAALALAAGLTQRADAAIITWIGGNANWDASNARWTPADEPDANDEAIFNTPNAVNLANATETIQALTLSGGIDLFTNNNDLIVDGLVQLAGASTNLRVSSTGSLLMADSIAINSGGTLRLEAGTVTMVEETGNGSFVVAAGGTLEGYGSIHLNDGSVAAGTPLLTLSGGTLDVNVGGSALTITLVDADARLDLDNLSAVIYVRRRATLEINGATHGATDPYSGTLNLYEGATIEMSVAWQTDSATINVNTADINGDPGAAATIAGAAFTLGGGTINLEASDSLRFSAPFTATAGAIANAGLLIFDADSTIGAGTDFQMTGSRASLTINAGVTVNIDDADFNADGIGAVTNVITIGSGGVLDLDLGTGADQALTGVINLNGGELDVTTNDDAWTIDGVVNVGADTGTSQINGEQVTITNATITVGANSQLFFNAPSFWSTTGNLVVNAGAFAILGGPTTFDSPGTFTGTGTLLTRGTTHFNSATVINMPGGTVDLDGGSLGSSTVTVDANVTINAGTMASFNSGVAFPPTTLELNNFANLTVNLTDPDGEWTLGSGAVLNIAAAGGMFVGSGIWGSDFNMQGTANITGNSLWYARTDISGTVNIALSGSLNLSGGDLSKTNRLEGGTITGAGVLRASTGDALVGFGTIATDIEFDDNSELRADDGILNVTGPIVDVGVIGTADADGILNVTTAWNTNAADDVELLRGEIRGATITNGGHIGGHGLISARVINDGFISAGFGVGLLVVETAGNNNDWDGTAGNGALHTHVGTLEIRDNATFPFTGGVYLDREVFVNGFALDFQPGSILNFTQGTYRCTHSTDFAGSLYVGPFLSGTLQVAGTFDFESGSATTLDQDLRLDNTLTLVRVGADFAGAGALINASGRTLRLFDGVTSGDLGVLVQNEGVLQVGSPIGDAQVQGTAFRQTATGTLQIELGGVALNAFDRLNLTGRATLAGGLNLSLIGGFVPVLGQTFNILVATGGISGGFTSMNQPPGMPPGLAFSVSQSAFVVRLVVTSSTFEDWINSFPSITDPDDKTRAANPDDDELNNLGEFALDGNPASGTATGKVVVKIAPVGGTNALTLTLPVRTGATLDPADPAGGELVLEKIADDLTYRIQATDELADWTLTVSEVFGADAASIQAGLPALNAGWVYRTFRSPGPVAGDPGEFMRVVIESEQ